MDGYYLPQAAGLLALHMIQREARDIHLAMSKRILLVICGITLIAIVGGWLVVRAETQPKVTFYGLVIDERGQPLADATVRLAVMENQLGPDGFRHPVPGTAHHQTLRSDSSGRFEVRAVPGNNLTILEVSRPGFEWVFEWAYGYGLPGALSSNQFYCYDPGDRMYVPDESRPAVFPLQRVGSPVAGRPSRGGTDRYPDGHIVRNEPVAPVLPSAGLGAPANSAERDEMLLKLSGRKRPGAVPSQPTTKQKAENPDSRL